MKAGLLSSDSIEKEVKDIAGCRIIFHVNSEVEKFMSSGIIHELFKIVENTYKIHHPIDAVVSSNDLYMADHFVVELSEALLADEQYAKFQGMRCEIQVCTVINHAYATLNHKIYKKPETEGFATKIYQDIEKRLISLAENHLIPAGYEFQKIYDDLNNLKVVTI